MRVAAYFMNEEEAGIARAQLKDAHFTKSFGIGTTTDLGTRRLREAGLVVQELPGEENRARPMAPRTPGQWVSLETWHLRQLHDFTRSPVGSLSEMRTAGIAPPGEEGEENGATGIVPFGDEVETPASIPDPPADTVFIIRFDGPLVESYRTALAKNGCVLLEAYGADNFTARIAPGKASDVGALSFVSSLRAYDDEDTLELGPPKDQRAMNKTTDILPAATAQWDVRLHVPSDRDAVVDWLNKAGVPVIGCGVRKVRISLRSDAAAKRDIAALPQVQALEQYVPPQLWNNRALGLIGATAPGVAKLGLDGNGQLIGIADTGIDVKHPDLINRIAKAVGLGRSDSFDDPHGHGTHVSGSVAGDGTASGGAIMGAVPKATIYFQSLLDDGGNLGGLPVDLGTLFQPAYDAGARIHSNSWGAGTPSTYTANSDEVDGFVHDHPDMLVVFAGGNQGTAAEPVNSGVGIVDWLSIGSPATAKNALTVGACQSDRADGPSAGRTWGQSWPTAFPKDPTRSEGITGNADCMAAFSSRGPCDDRRIKPDLVAPGTDILSTKSSIADDRHFWGIDPARPNYAFMGGTSMATPLVSGCAALVRQYFVERKHQPSAALLRATLVNGTHWLQGTDSNASNPKATTPPANFDQGFGRLDMTMSLPGDAFLYFVDTWKDANGSLTTTGDYRRFQIKVGSASYLRICLAYTDVPGRGLQNNLNLMVQPATGGAKLVGNAQLWGALGVLDVDNNVEVVRLNAPSPGDYIVQVMASNLLHPPQDFALVVTSDEPIGGTQIA